jgi:hypothetical protein
MKKHTENYAGVKPAPKVEVTRDYALFTLLDCNRVVDQSKMNRLDASIAEIDLTPFFPIVVRETKGRLAIHDGQTRFAVCKARGMPVYYVRCGAIEERHIALLNCAHTRWSTEDFLRHYTGKGSADYITLKAYADDNGLRISDAARLLNVRGKLESGSVLEAFRRGAFRVTSEAHADEMAFYIAGLATINAKVARDGYFVRALSGAVRKGIYRHEVFMRQLRERSR